MSRAAPEAPLDRVPLADLWWVFIKIGSVSFGGFMPLISMVESIVVAKRKLMRHEDMLDGITLANLLPGPQAVNCVAYVGYRLRGAAGALVCVLAVLAPTFVLMIGLATLYFRYASDSTALTYLFAGFIPAVAAVIVSVVHRMAKSALRGRTELALAGVAAVALMTAPREMNLYVTFGIVASFGAIGYFLFRAPSVATSAPQVVPVAGARIVATLAPLGALLITFLSDPPLDPRGFAQIALTFGGLSLMLFGGGYVFIPMIHDTIVGDYAWVTEQQFTDGIAFGQMTPGPVLISAAFFAFKVVSEQYGWCMGVVAALVATASIFGPPAVLMVAGSTALDTLKRSSTVQAAMKGIRCGIVGMIVVAAVTILRLALPAWPGGGVMAGLGIWLAAAWPTAVIFMASFAALMKYQLDLVWVVPSAGILGMFLYPLAAMSH